MGRFGSEVFLWELFFFDGFGVGWVLWWFDRYDFVEQHDTET
jgi:hypothetical protein